MTSSAIGRVSQALPWLLALYAVASLLHFVHNAEHLAQYPNLPSSWSRVDVYLVTCAWMIVGLTLGFVVTRAVFAPGQVTFHRIMGAVLLYLNIGITFMALFSFVALMVPNAFSGMGTLQDDLGVARKMIYFSFVTLTSVGYGDISPLHPFARSLANIEAIIGQLYPATLLARLVTLEIAGRHGQ